MKANGIDLMGRDRECYNGRMEKPFLDEKGKEEVKKHLKPIPNSHPEKEYLIELVTDELTAICPFYGNPDFYRLRILYVPDQTVVELKSLKFYITAFRDYRTTHENLLNTIFDQLQELMKPRYMLIELDVAVRGGIKTRILRESGERPRIFEVETKLRI
ncbi:MAG: preQ(1) synthase [Candidatus Hydrothermota bacterium]|uniref:NADPH-dependent 7-cyano-7-deazaguanine reductase n=1 Tax=candidate division WOR-3 bacterium TaxID=2052148 RepID=A0A7C1B476_UNCW3|nr:MAG: preQ(1) synthase [Candidatus Hydrothermae bacterium]HDM90559.1 preQ(1) synthase [candidate division WOR-3 bacterium]